MCSSLKIGGVGCLNLQKTVFERGYSLEPEWRYPERATALLMMVFDMLIGKLSVFVTVFRSHINLPEIKHE